MPPAGKGPFTVCPIIGFFIHKVKINEFPLRNKFVLVFLSSKILYPFHEEEIRFFRVGQGITGVNNGRKEYPHPS